MIMQTSRLLIMDRRDFNRLGLSLDDMLDAYIQVHQAALLSSPS